MPDKLLASKLDNLLLCCLAASSDLNCGLGSSVIGLNCERRLGFSGQPSSWVRPLLLKVEMVPPWLVESSPDSVTEYSVAPLPESLLPSQLELGHSLDTIKPSTRTNSGHLPYPTSRLSDEAFNGFFGFDIISASSTESGIGRSKVSGRAGTRTAAKSASKPWTAIGATGR